jgi:hypothetical protein
MDINITNSQIETITNCLQSKFNDNKFDIETSINFCSEDVEKTKVRKAENLKIQRILDKFFEEQHKGFKFTKHQEVTS